MNVEVVLAWPSVNKVRQQYGYSATWIYNLLSSGVLLGYQINGRWHIDPQSLKQFECRSRRWKKRSPISARANIAEAVVKNVLRAAQ